LKEQSQRATQRQRNRAEFDADMLAHIDRFIKHFGAKVWGAVNDETGYAVGRHLPRKKAEP